MAPATADNRAVASIADGLIVPRTFAGTPSQVEKMVAAWRAIGGDVESLTRDSFGTLEQRSDVRIARVPENIPSDANLRCSVAGGYRSQTNPPTLVVTEAMSRRRQQFTLLHELGHHLQRTVLELGEAVVAHDQPGEFEDACCDAFAAQILLPSQLLTPFLDKRGPTASGAAALFSSSNASRAAICVRLAPFMSGSGVIAVLDESGTVTFAASHGGMYPPARGSDQARNPLVAAAIADSQRTTTLQRNDARIWYRDGHSTPELYGQAAWSDGRLFIVMAEYGVAWLALSPPRETKPLYLTSKWETCETCGTNFVVLARCPTCGEPKCPSGHCACTKAATRTCPECFLVKPRGQFPPGSDICSDCAA